MTSTDGRLCRVVLSSSREVDYDKQSDEAQDALAEYYKRCSGVTMGIGLIDPLTGVWKPLPLVPTGGRQGDPGVPPWDTP